MYNNTIKLRIIIAFSVFILLNTVLISFATAKWRVITKEYSISKIKYSIHKDNLKQINGLYFPEFFLTDTALYYGFNPIGKLKIPELNNIYPNTIYAWRKVFNEPLMCCLDSTFLYARIFVEGIESFIIYFYSKNEGSWYEKEFKAEYEGYQVPLVQSLSNWKLVNDDINHNSISMHSDVEFLNGKRQDTINEIVIVVNQKNKRHNFIIGDLKIFDIELKDVDYYHPFFDKITKINSFRYLEKDSFYKFPGRPTLLSSLIDYSHFKHSSCNLFLINDCKNYDKEHIVIEVFHEIFNHYPFYNVRDINKDQILMRFDKICSDSLPYSVFIDSLSEIVREFNDPHFFIPDERKKDRRLNPVRLYEINNHVYISAVFDSSVAETIQVGDEIVDIDNKPVEEIIDSLKLKDFNRDVSNLLIRGKEEKAILKLVKNYKDTIDVIIGFDKKLAIPDNFKPKHCEFKRLNESISYFRINRWDMAVPIRFLNYANELNKSRGLIIDLRSNTGGEGIAVERLLSYFIKKPTIYLHSCFSINQNMFESVLITPNPVYNFNMSVVILVNENTACASEIFAYTMKRNTNSIIVGNSSTFGVFSSRYLLNFPDGLSVNINCLDFELVPPNRIIEVNGIKPDIWVQINKIDDLYPYNDKITKIAETLLMSMIK